MSYGDEQAEARRLHSILKEGEASMTPSASPLDLAELRRLAEAATPGPWFVGLDNEEVMAGPDEYVTMDHEGLLSSVDPKDAAYIAAANPSVILALLDFIESVAATSNDPHLAREAAAALKGPAR